MRRSAIGEVEVRLEYGPLRGQRITVPLDCVNVIQYMDDGAVVCYSRWSDLVFRFDAINSDGPAHGIAS